MMHFIIKKKIPLLAFGDLSGEEKKELEKHLGHCPECRELLRQYRLLAGEITGDKKEQPDFLRDGEWAALIAKAVRHQPRRDRKTLLPGWAALAAAGLLVFALLYLLEFRKTPAETSFRADSALRTPGVRPGRGIAGRETLRKERSSRKEPGGLGEVSATIREAAAKSSRTSRSEAPCSLTIEVAESGTRVIWFFDEKYDFNKEKI